VVRLERYFTATSEERTMKDRDFLLWIHERLEHVHGEKPAYDYMHKLKAVAEAQDPKQDTRW
jgi:hypothetical protein